MFGTKLNKSVIDRFTVKGAKTGAVCGFTIGIVATGFAYLATPGWPGLIELADQFWLICIWAATGAVIGSVVGLIVGIAASVYFRNKK